jgi:RimJ/RimL family protein N-acetyltransferase
MTPERARQIDLQPTLVGESLLLRPLRPADFEALYAVASDPLIWEQHPEPTRYQRAVFEGFFAGALASRGALAVLRRDDGTIIGSSRYYDWDEAKREVAIGFTFLDRRYWGGTANGEMKRLMLEHAFRWADTVWFHVGKHNWRSRKALEKIGARYSHEVLREAGGVAQDHVHYRISAADWPGTADPGSARSRR